MINDLRLRVMAQIAMWAALESEIGPIPRHLVDATPYDEHVLASGEAQKLAKMFKNSPWAASGHYGKEMNLMVSGLKRVALIGMDEIDAWTPHLDSGLLVGIITGMPSECAIIQAEDARLLPAILMALRGGLESGVCLGYEPEDIVRCVRAENRMYAKMEPITDEEHAALMKAVTLIPHKGYKRQWFNGEGEAADAVRIGWEPLLDDDGKPRRRNVSSSDSNPLWSYAMEYPI